MIEIDSEIIDSEELMRRVKASALKKEIQKLFWL